MSPGPFKTALLLAGLVTTSPSAAAPNDPHLSAAQLLRLADAATAKGDLAMAERAYRALIGDPSQEIRLEARYRLAILERKRGRLTDAASLLRQILDHRPDALPVRLELAGILDKLGDRDGAWRQVRAAQAAGLPPAVARMVDRYSEALRAQRPFGASLEIALAPDSNINRATRSEILGTVLGDFAIADDGKARSGTGVSIQGQIYRRLALNADSSLLVRAASSANLYRRTEYNDVAVDVAVGPEISFRRDRLQLELGSTLRWFGQKPFMRSARIALTVSHPLGRRTLFRLTGSGALIDNQLNDLQDGRNWAVQANIERALTPDAGVIVFAGADRQSLKDAAYSTTGWRVGLTGWRDIGRMTLVFGAESGTLNADDRLALFPAARSDRSSRLSVGASFRRLEFRGLAPIVRFSIERNKSNIAFYDYRRVRTEFGVVRAF